jgi:hypothetical protein
MTSAGDGETLDLTALTVDSHSFTLERRSMVLLLQLARLALIVAALSRCGGLRGRFARRRQAVEGRFPQRRAGRQFPQRLTDRCSQR